MINYIECLDLFKTIFKYPEELKEGIASKENLKMIFANSALIANRIHKLEENLLKKLTNKSIGFEDVNSLYQVLYLTSIVYKFRSVEKTTSIPALKKMGLVEYLLKNHLKLTKNMIKTILTICSGLTMLDSIEIGDLGKTGMMIKS